jgi:hypothetical protein
VTSRSRGEAALTIAEREAFEALIGFTVKMRDLGWPSLPGLLGGMQLIDGFPSDPGVWEDWHQVVMSLAQGVARPGERRLSSEAAYKAVFLFLGRQFQKRGIESLTEVVARLEATPPDSLAREVTDDWNDILRQTHPMNDIPNLHDATLISVHVDWAQKGACIRVRHGWPATFSDLTLSGLQRLSVTALDEWGPSLHILSVRTEPNDTSCRIIIEMQSGDTIDATATSFEFLAAPDVMDH